MLLLFGDKFEEKYGQAAWKYNLERILENEDSEEAKDDKKPLIAPTIARRQRPKRYELKLKDSSICPTRAMVAHPDFVFDDQVPSSSGMATYGNNDDKAKHDDEEVNDDVKVNDTNSNSKNKDDDNKKGKGKGKGA